MPWEEGRQWVISTQRAAEVRGANADLKCDGTPVLSSSREVPLLPPGPGMLHRAKGGSQQSPGKEQSMLCLEGIKALHLFIKEKDMG